jgi:hypothetical protein
MHKLSIQTYFTSSLHAIVMQSLKDFEMVEMGILIFREERDVNVVVNVSVFPHRWLSAKKAPSSLGCDSYRNGSIE